MNNLVLSYYILHGQTTHFIGINDGKKVKIKVYFVLSMVRILHCTQQNLKCKGSHFTIGPKLLAKVLPMVYYTSLLSMYSSLVECPVSEILAKECSSPFFHGHGKVFPKETFLLLGQESLIENERPVNIALYYEIFILHKYQ